MEAQKKVTSHILKAAIIAILMNAVQFFAYSKHEIKAPTYSIVAYAIFFVGIVVSGLIYKKQIEKTLTFGAAFGHSFKTVATVIIFHFVLFLLAVKLIFPWIPDAAVADASLQMKKLGFTPDQMKESLNRSRQYFVPLTMGTMIVGYGILGLIASAVSSALIAGKSNRSIANV